MRQVGAFKEVLVPLFRRRGDTQDGVAQARAVCVLAGGRGDKRTDFPRVHEAER